VSRLVLKAIVVQQPKSDVAEDDVGVAPAMLMAMATGSVVNGDTVVFPVQGDSDGTIGAGTTICGLSPDAPASVAAEGIVASLYDGPVMVARPGIGATAVLLKNSVRF
jgi:hypothetical protein